MKDGRTEGRGWATGRQALTASRASKQAARTSVGLVLFDKTTYSLKFASYLAGLSKISRQILLGIPGSLIPRVMIC